MEKICGIYKITNPKKKVYIGQSGNIKSRFSYYKRLHCKGQSKLYYSLKKYGVQKHKFEVLHQCDLEKLNELECYYIELFQCYNNEYGLNLRSGGHNQYKHSEGTKQKMSKTRKGRVSHRKGKTLSEEHKQKLSEAGKKRIHSEETKQKMSDTKIGKNNYMFGKKHSEEIKEKMSEIKKGEKNPFYGKKHSDEAKRKMSEARKERIMK